MSDFVLSRVQSIRRTGNQTGECLMRTMKQSRAPLRDKVAKTGELLILSPGYG